MTYKNLMVFFVAVFALALAAQSVSAFGSIAEVEFDDVVVFPTATPVNLANFAGSRIPVEIRFLATDYAEDVRVKAWISGEREQIATSDRFVVEANGTYKMTVMLDIPFDIDELSETRSLKVVVESKRETADEVTVDFKVQRESYVIEILNTNMQPEIKAGESLVVDTVLKNRGRQLADDVFLKVRIPELGLETRTYFGDLSAVDESDPDRDDSVERRTFLRIPLDAPAGVYTVEFEAFNSDSFTSMERRILVNGAEEDTMAVASTLSKKFAPGEEAEYKLTLVNRGSIVRVYQLSATSPSGLNVELSDALVVIPAGSSRTVSIFADSTEEDDYTFSVKVLSDEGEMISEKTFVANVEGDAKKTSVTSGTSDATILLTVVLAIIFIVLLVVLIVLLTRKPESKEEFGESYY